ncbi:uncharacterized protein LOC123703966 [Colias croceus]|uniref:uncharacterized protein LOC123703966 n=1 Tax=Colias crocea TaxID=72248 RepID=UPI001E27E845|nr:uncharacterized protein LOC123703966 [Colias croceus]
MNSQTLMQYFDEKFESWQQKWRDDLLAAIREVSSSFKCDIERLESRLLESEQRITELEQVISTSKSFNPPDLSQENTQLRADLKNLQSKFDDLDQASRNCNVEIQNVPEKKTENLIHLSIEIGKLIGVKITETDIRSVHRVAPGSASNRPKNIILQLSSRRLRDNIIAAARARRTLTVAALLGTPTSATATVSQSARFYINEHLTLKNKMLFRSVRQHAQNMSYKYVWVKNACILIRKTDESRAIHIKDICDLDKIK